MTWAVSLRARGRPVRGGHRGRGRVRTLHDVEYHAFSLYRHSRVARKLVRLKWVGHCLWEIHNAVSHRQWLVANERFPSVGRIEPPTVRSCSLIHLTLGCQALGESDY